jgi:hypothetical protein
MGEKIDPSLFRQVKAEDYNYEEAAKGSPIRVEDRNGNGLVDHEDAFYSVGPQDINLKTNVHLHRMCMEGLERPPASRPSVVISVDERARRNLTAFNPAGELAVWGHPFLGRFIGFLGGREDLVRGPAGLIPVVYAEGRYDADLKGCNDNKTMSVKGGIRRDILKVEYENATGAHKEVWNLRTGRVRFVK